MASPDYVRTTLKDVSDSLAPFRPPTAPESDIEEEKKKIITGGGPNFLFLQVVLAVLSFSILAYVLLPVSIAQHVSVLLLSVGIAVGIFLWKG